jgi:hypothetical protein
MSVNGMLDALRTAPFASTSVSSNVAAPDTSVPVPAVLFVAVSCDETVQVPFGSTPAVLLQPSAIPPRSGACRPARPSPGSDAAFAPYGWCVRRLVLIGAQDCSPSIVSIEQRGIIARDTVRNAVPAPKRALWRREGVRVA